MVIKSIPLSQRRIEFALLAILVAATIALYAAFTRPGVTWADDWATYIQDALNLLHGNAYSQWGYIVDRNLDIGPKAYPPLYPLMLTLPISIWGIDFDAIRQAQLILWAAILVFVYLLARERLDSFLSLLVVAAVGFSPYFFSFKDYITSEALFLALLFATFALTVRIEKRAPDGQLSSADGVWLGIMLSLCIATRSLGLILLPTLVGYDIVQFRRLRRSTIIATAIPAIVFLMQLILLDFVGDYLATISLDSRNDFAAAPAAVAANGGLLHSLQSTASVVVTRFAVFLLEFSRFWSEGSKGDNVARLTSVVFVTLAIRGFSIIRRRDLMHSDVFALLYAASLLILPSTMAIARYQMPLAPMFYTYVLMGAGAVSIPTSRLARAAMAIAVALGIASYWQSYRNLEVRAPLEGIELTEYRDMFDYIRNNTQPDSGIIFDKPRTLALFTQRRSAALYGTRKGDELIAYMRAIGAEYILVYDAWNRNVSREDYLKDILRDHVDEFELRHDSGRYALYQAKS